MAQTKKPKSEKKQANGQTGPSGLQTASGEYLLELVNKHNQELKDSGEYLENAPTTEEILGSGFGAVMISIPRKKKG